ncbi:MAG: hypothetical protein E7332_04760 [Clostridiales bacterium]|nr:hypothetical protein [Clostridiales bacterium]
MPNKTLENLHLPALKSREEMLAILLEEEYGHLPEKPSEISWRSEMLFEDYAGGKADLLCIHADCRINGKDFSFPFYAKLPKDGKQHPFFIHINFRDSVPDRYEPSEEILDNGFAVLTVCYNDVTMDNEDMNDGLAGVLFGGKERKDNDPGKIAMWAWAVHRLMDYAETRTDVLDLSCAIVCGHSRLGKTALLAAATDRRFAFVYANESGNSGAALARPRDGETISQICTKFPFWFCKNYLKYVDNEAAMPFDQHYLLACAAPAKLALGCASGDTWAGIHAQQMAALAAAPFFGEHNIPTDRFAEIGEEFFEGNIGYHLRQGTHFFNRDDWQKAMKFVNMHR